ncbi:hypothetical protein [Nostoc sp.]|uniref:hypothetical protein n=1 Tax=Nostoc sp. TaxID=1180 RepID=UPI002FFC6FEF
MFSVRHLQRRREELQQQYDLLSEKIKRYTVQVILEKSEGIPERVVCSNFWFVWL